MGSSAAMMASSFQAAGSLYQGYSTNQNLAMQSEFETMQAETNARILELKIGKAKEQGEKDAAEVKKRAGQLKGAQKVASAASGVVVDFGSAQELQSETDLLSSIDAERVKNNSMLEAWGYKIQQSNILGTARMNALVNKNKGIAALITGTLSAAGHAFDAYSKRPEFTVDSDDKRTVGLNFDPKKTEGLV